ncbi:SH3 and multiple ankyrin repeat domains protein 2 isoform X3 [Diabrotica virgifera virgifera]|uniref:SH3 and multiple ankyrin repeat domains protein 3 n=2 Tax=Diabrotica virgifera virgifera TaxID=50390 RepID=A0ABM5IGC9_DIAVI|nr:SH3 and multiple ankyrin repeat domains protein 2 isoform X3 [Diabrotica virgifera virgifera]
MSMLWRRRKRKEILEDMWSFTSTSTCEELARLMEEEDERGPEEGHLLVRIHVPELNVQKCLQFPRDQLVWDVKQQCLAALPKELKESFNYGLFCPPDNGRAGKFLDEERRLGDYPFNGPVGYLELKYKRRVYKMMSLDEKQLKSLHTRANLRRFIDYVQNGQVEKITKICSKGLDPNFHCQETGETPLTIATGIKKPAKVLMALVNGGALLDYRKKDGSTALHRAVEHRSLEALKTLLELGASPNYKDNKGLTPLYYTITLVVDPTFTETLLHDHATTGAQDAQGWQEVHQACRTGLQAHLEHLLFYGADMNAQNASGNTPLHVCAVNGQESCARQLLFRGADRQALNYANQTPCQVAVIAGNMELAEIIQKYKQEDVVPFRGPPSYNPKRRSAIGWLNRAPSMSTLALPPSPCPSDRSSAPFSSASSSLSEGSALPGHETDTASIVTVFALGVTDKSLGDTSDIISDSSGVGTANSDTTNCTIWMPGSTVVCIESYTSKEDGHISIREGDIIEVLAATDDGYLEGKIKSGGGRTGYFPASCAQEVRLRHHNIQAPMMVAKDPRPPSQTSSRVLGRRESTSKHFATAPRTTKKSFANLPAEPRTVVLHKGKKGFGFILRGAKATSPLMDLTPSDKCPALQYLDDVDPGGVADIAGLKKGDFLLEINNEDVSSASHEHVVDLIRKSGDLVQMTVMSLGPPVCGVLPMSKSTILPGGTGTIPLSSRFATLPRKAVTYGGTLGRSTQAPLPPRRDPKTTLSVGRARAKSMVAGLGGEKDETDDITKSSSAESIHQSTPGSTCTSTPVQPRTASIRQRPSSTSLKHSVLEELFQKQKESSIMSQSSLMSSSRFQCSNSSGSPSKGRVYASVAEMKRSKSKNPKVKFTELFTGGKELKRTFHSTPDLVQDLAYNCQTLPSKFHRSQEDISLLLGNRSLPPPSHPPPPIPSHVQLVKVDVSRGKHSEYDHLNREIPDEGIVSSFNPTASAKLYASPEDMKTVGYRSKSLPSHTSKTQIRKSQSMRTNNTFKPTNNNNVSNKVPADTQQSNPYAQPIRASRSHSTGSRERRKKVPSSKSNPKLSQQPGAPPIPEPDYSCTDSEGESESVPRKTDSLASRINSIQLQATENSGNSNASGSSSGSSSIPHSFSVEEIQRGRSLLKSSKSYPDDLLKKQKEADAALEDGDNSSSGVSSDQEIMPCGNTELTEQNSIVPGNKNQRAQIGTLKRHAVSLAQLPPPIENETDEKEEFCLPPPPEFGENNPNFSDVVVAPPPQFSDNRQITRVRIVGAVPKGTLAVNTQPKLKQNRLHSQ